MSDRDVPPKNRYAYYPDSMYSKMYLKNVAGAGFRWIGLERKKTPKRLFSMTYRIPWNSVDRYLERETRLELATPTLARSCSTN